ncbi:hypothetical protein [Niastella populi]|nr:hypothetical protein [Niastella populi]
MKPVCIAFTVAAAVFIRFAWSIILEDNEHPLMEQVNSEKLAY